MVKHTMANRRTFLQAAGAGIAVSATAGCLGGDDDGPQIYSIGTSSEGSGSFRAAAVFAEFLTREGLDDDVDLDPVTTPGTLASFRMLDEGEVDMAASNAVLLDDAPDTGTFEDEPLGQFDDVRQIRGYMDLVQFFAVKPTIDSWDDLEDETISSGTPGGGTTPTNEELIELGIGLDNVSNNRMEYGDVPDAWAGDRISLCVPWATNQVSPAGWLVEIETRDEWQALPFTDEMTSLIDGYPFARNITMDAEDFSDEQTGAVDAYGVNYMWTTHAGVDDDAVYAIAQHSYENAAQLIEQDDIMMMFDDPEAFLGGLHPDVPVHKGAYDYYQDSGLWDEYGEHLTPPPEA